MVRGYSEGELRLIIAQERQNLTKERSTLITEINARSRRIKQIEDRLAELDKGEDLLNDSD